MYLLLVNPTSGGGKGKTQGQIVRDYLTRNSLDFLDISGSSYESAASALALAIRKTPRLEAVIVIGGDGMVHLAIQELAKSSIPLLLIPAGTGNDFARSLGLPLSDPIAILEHARKSSATAIDVGTVNGRYFGEVLSTGFDSVVNERANRMRLISGRSKYNLAILLELPLFKARRYAFSVDGARFEVDAMLIAIANGASYGGGMRVCPDAKLDDGRFDLMILEPVSKFEFLRVFPRVFSGSHINHPRVRIMRGSKVEVRAQAVAYADGERIGQLPITAEIAPSALRTWRFT